MISSCVASAVRVLFIATASSTQVDVMFLGQDRADRLYRGKASGKVTTAVFQLARRKSTRWAA